MCSLEVHDDYVAQDMKDWEGASISYNCNYEATLIFLVSELNRHNVQSCYIKIEQGFTRFTFSAVISKPLELKRSYIPL